jgi:hypothetical protein
MTLTAFILSLLVLNPRHELVRNHELRYEVAGYFQAAGEKYYLPPDLVAWHIYSESTFRHRVIGKRDNLGSVGYAQVHGTARELCEAAGYDVETRKGGAYCAAHLIRAGLTECNGTLIEAFEWYATGSCRGSDKARRKMKHRLAEWMRRTTGGKNESENNQN